MVLMASSSVFPYGMMGRLSMGKRMGGEKKKIAGGYALRCLGFVG
jgi:hypothetical protein